MKQTKAMHYLKPLIHVYKHTVYKQNTYMQAPNCSTLSSWEVNMSCHLTTVVIRCSLDVSLIHFEVYAPPACSTEPLPSNGTH